MNVSLAVSCWCVFRISYKITQALDVSRLLMWTFLPSCHSSVLIRHIANLCVCLVIQSTLINRSLALMSGFECVTDSFFPHPNNTIRFIQSQRLQELSPLCFCTQYHRLEDRKKIWPLSRSTYCRMVGWLRVKKMLKLTLNLFNGKTQSQNRHNLPQIGVSTN